MTISVPIPRAALLLCTVPHVLVVFQAGYAAPVPQSPKALGSCRVWGEAGFTGLGMQN